MDIKVYEKEKVLQPSGTSWQFVPNVIDLIPVVTTDSEGNEIITGAEELESDSQAELEQECALATIWQKGADPIDEDDGISWAQALLGEASPVQLMEEITNAVANVTASVQVEFGTATADNGSSYLTYTLKGVA